MVKWFKIALKKHACQLPNKILTFWKLFRKFPRFPPTLLPPSRTLCHSVLQMLSFQVLPTHRPPPHRPLLERAQEP